MSPVWDHHLLFQSTPPIVDRQGLVHNLSQDTHIIIFPFQSLSSDNDCGDAETNSCDRSHGLFSFLVSSSKETVHYVCISVVYYVLPISKAQIPMHFKTVVFLFV